MRLWWLKACSGGGMWWPTCQFPAICRGQQRQDGRQVGAVRRGGGGPPHALIACGIGWMAHRG